jgi:thiamine-phosphate pyrophosphorylase
MTNLIVISSEADIKNETGIVNDLFHSGLRLFHLRKPHFTLDTQRNFLSKIEKQFHDQISVHQNYETVNEFGLMYYHVKEKDRAVMLSPSKLDTYGFADAGIQKSTSFHNYADLQFESHKWDYCFFGPVFNSISKAGYNSILKEDFHNEGDIHQRVFALGGITKTNIRQVFEKEFFGAAVLGSVWNDPLNAVKNYKELEALCKQSVHTF